MKPSVPVHEPPVANRTVRPRAISPWQALIGWMMVAALAVVILMTADKHGPVSTDNANPDGLGKPPPVQPLLHPLDWLTLGQILGALLAAGTIVASILVWRRHPGHPVILMTLA
ncbi:DUF5135 domain-containing protein, partial [Mycobacterium sp. WUMAC-067]|nr:DUF5135 domain-containing protein [Mycobacterium sp. WUMAC-067]MCA2317987.1 DUF5135 domain-containing protein [Mycobacterium sp. WUMAC-025]